MTRTFPTRPSRHDDPSTTSPSVPNRRASSVNRPHFCAEASAVRCRCRAWNGRPGSAAGAGTDPHDASPMPPPAPCPHRRRSRPALVSAHRGQHTGLRHRVGRDAHDGRLDGRRRNRWRRLDRARLNWRWRHRPLFGWRRRNRPRWRRPPNWWHRALDRFFHRRGSFFLRLVRWRRHLETATASAPAGSGHHQEHEPRLLQVVHVLGGVVG